MSNHAQGQTSDEHTEGEQVILTLPGSITLYSGGEEYQLGAYVRFADEQGRELYYHWREWAESPEEVMGVILAIIQDPRRLHDFIKKSETI
jgi:hypothetical protein